MHLCVCMCMCGLCMCAHRLICCALRGQRRMSGPLILFTLCLIPLRQSLSLNPALMWFLLSLPSSVLAYQGMWPHSAFYVGTRIWTCLQVCKARTLTYWAIFAAWKSFFLTKHKTKALYFLKSLIWHSALSKIWRKRLLFSQIPGTSQEG